MNLNELTSESWQFIIDRTETLPQGVNLWYRGVPYPRRVYYDKLKDVNFFLRTLDALGVVKKNLSILLHLKGLVIPIRFSIKKYSLFLNRLHELFNWQLAEFMIKDEEYSVPVWEFGKFVHRFLWEVGFDAEIAAKYTRIAMMILEFDNAYRYRLQDLIPYIQTGDIKKTIEIYLQRELLHQDNPDFGARGKILKFGKLLQAAMWIPSVKRAWNKAAKSADWEKMKFDDSDRFHFAFWRGYDYEGKTFQERYEPYSEIYKAAPFIKRQDPKVTLDFMTGA